MVSVRSRGYDDEDDCVSRKRVCNKSCSDISCNALDRSADPACELLHQFSLAQGAYLPDQDVSELAWRCWAEFNVVLRAHAGQLSDIPLCGYHSITRDAKGSTFQKLLAAEGMQRPGQQWPLHAHIISRILQRFFFQYADASICRYTVEQPFWLMQWSNKWGYAGRQVSLFAVNAYHDRDWEPMHVHGGELQADSAALNRTLFVPVFPA